MVADYSAVLGTRGKLVSEPMLLNFFRGQSDRFEPEPTGEGVFQVPDVFLANSEGAQKGLELIQGRKLAGSHPTPASPIGNERDPEAAGRRVARGVKSSVDLLDVHARILARRSNRGPRHEEAAVSSLLSCRGEVGAHDEAINGRCQLTKIFLSRKLNAQLGPAKARVRHVKDAVYSMASEMLYPDRIWFFAQREDSKKLVLLMVHGRYACSDNLRHGFQPPSGFPPPSASRLSENFDTEETLR